MGSGERARSSHQVSDRDQLDDETPARRPNTATRDGTLPGPSARVGPVFVTTHVLSGVLIGRAAGGRPTLAFAAGVGSHLALDSIPHWGCDKWEDGGHEGFLKVAKRDGLAGLATIAAALAAVDKRDRLATVAAIAGAVLLDLDKPCQYFVGVNPFPPVVVRLHSRVQNESADGMPREIAYAALFALADAIAIAARRSSGSSRGRLPV